MVINNPENIRLPQGPETGIASDPICDGRAPGAVPLLDQDLLDGLLGFLGEGLEAVYVNYFTECATSIDLLASESAGGDPYRVRKIAHQMLGASSTLGMLRLATAFATIGEDAENQQLPQHEWIVDVRRLLDLSMEAIHEVDFGPPVEG